MQTDQVSLNLLEFPKEGPSAVDPSLVTKVFHSRLFWDPNTVGLTIFVSSDAFHKALSFLGNLCSHFAEGLGSLFVFSSEKVDVIFDQLTRWLHFCC